MGLDVRGGGNGPPWREKTLKWQAAGWCEKLHNNVPPWLHHVTPELSEPLVYIRLYCTPKDSNAGVCAFII